jgi:nicotinamidase-related amidase
VAQAPPAAAAASPVTAALVVVDVQNGFVSDHNRAVVPAIVRLVRAWTGPVVFTRYHNYAGSPYERLHGWHEMYGPPDTDLVAELAPLVGTAPVVDKRIYSLFTAEGRALVAARGWHDLVFCGIATESCVLKSAADAFELGYTPWLVTDACASDYDAAAHAAGLVAARQLIGPGQLITSDEALARA